MTSFKVVQFFILGSLLFQNTLAINELFTPEDGPDVNFAPAEDADESELTRNERAFELGEEMEDYENMGESMDDIAYNEEYGLKEYTSAPGAQIINQNNGKPIVVYAGNKCNDDVKQYPAVEQPGLPCDAKTKVTKTRPQTYIHHQAPILIKRQPTTLKIDHEPVLIQPSPVVFHRQPSVTTRPVIHKELPQKVEVRPYVVKVERPVEKKILLEKPKKPCSYKVEDELRDMNRGYNAGYGMRSGPGLID